MMVVQIEKPGNMSLANWFSELRSWFDQNYGDFHFKAVVIPSFVGEHHCGLVDLLAEYRLQRRGVHFGNME